MREVPLRDGGVAKEGESVATDQLAFPAILEYRTLVLPRSPVLSRPASPYHLVRVGKYYEVWQRPAEYAGPTPEHQPYGEGIEPTTIPDCGEIGGLGLYSLYNHKPVSSMLAARHAPVYDATDGDLTVPRTGEYEAWLGGSVRGSATVYVDGQRVGEARQQLETDGGFIPLGETHLTKGSHEVELRIGGADLSPGSGGFPRPKTGPLLFSPADEEGGQLVSVPYEKAKCFSIAPVPVPLFFTYERKRKENCWCDTAAQSDQGLH